MNERIRQLRLALKMTLEQFGEKIGFSISGLSDVEKGRRTVKDRHIMTILAAFPDVSEEWLRTGNGEMFGSGEKSASSYKFTFEEICQKLMEVYDSLDRERQLAVLEFVNKLVENMAEKKPTPEEEIEQKVQEYRKALLDEYQAGLNPSELDSSAG